MIFRKIIFGNRSELGAHALAVNLSLLHTARPGMRPKRIRGKDSG